MAALSLQGDDPTSWLREGAPSGRSVVPAPAAPPAQLGLILEAVVGVLQGVPVAGPRLLRLQAGAQALWAPTQRLDQHPGKGSALGSSQRTNKFE